MGNLKPYVCIFNANSKCIDSIVQDHIASSTFRLKCTVTNTKKERHTYSTGGYSTREEAEKDKPFYEFYALKFSQCLKAKWQSITDRKKNGMNQVHASMFAEY